MLDADSLDDLGWLFRFLPPEEEAALLVVDYVDSTGRKIHSLSAKFELGHILYHNLLPFRETRAGVLVKSTGDGCIVCFSAEEAGGVGNACQSTVRAAARFRADVDRFNAAPGRREQVKIHTRCSLHVGGIRFIDYAALYGRAVAHDESSFPKLSCPIDAATRDPHGSAVDVCCRMLTHCRRGQVLASEAFCLALGDDPTAYAVKFGSQTAALPIRGLTDPLAAREIVCEGCQELGVKAKHVVDWEAAIPGIEVLKACDDAIFRLTQQGLAEQTRLAARELESTMQTQKSIGPSSESGRRGQVWKFINELLYGRHSSRGMALSESLERVEGMKTGELITGLGEVLSGEGIDCGNYQEVLATTALPDKLVCVRDALRACAGGNVTGRLARKVLCSSEWSGSEYERLANSVAELAKVLVQQDLALHQGIDEAIRSALWMTD